MVMQRATHPSPIAILREHVEAWRRDNRWSRETVADMIVQAHYRIGAPAWSGIVFEPHTTDTFERMRVNADRIFRWLDDVTKDKNHLPFNFQLSVYAALPEDRRVLLLNDLLAPLAMHVEAGGDGDQEVPTPTSSKPSRASSITPRRPRSPPASCSTASIPAKSIRQKRSSASSPPRSRRPAA